MASGLLSSGICSLYVLLVLVLVSSANGCDLYKGSWVYDASYPLYDATKCALVDKEFNCQKNGRPDNIYLKYRWKPFGCELPRFNGVDLLKRLKGKKIMFVGDSLSYNQFQSFICMLHSSVPQARYTYTNFIFTLPEFQVSVIFSHNVYLVDLVTEARGRILKIDSIDGSEWKNIDMLIFNTYHWWLHTGKLQNWDYIEEGNKLYKDMNRLVAYQKGLITWSKWVEANIDPTKTKIFFQGISPTHTDGAEWNEPNATCTLQKTPLTGSTYHGAPIPAVSIVMNVLSKMSKPVELLDITLLSQLRKDGHPSYYGLDGMKGSDCSHWCLAGVPDTWNQLLYTSIVHKN